MPGFDLNLVEESQEEGKVRQVLVRAHREPYQWKPFPLLLVINSAWRAKSKDNMTAMVVPLHGSAPSVGSSEKSEFEQAARAILFIDDVERLLKDIHSLQETDQAQALEVLRRSLRQLSVRGVASSAVRRAPQVATGPRANAARALLATVTRLRLADSVSHRPDLLDVEEQLRQTLAAMQRTEDVLKLLPAASGQAIEPSKLMTYQKLLDNHAWLLDENGGGTLEKLSRKQWEPADLGLTTDTFMDGRKLPIGPALKLFNAALDLEQKHSAECKKLADAVLTKMQEKLPQLAGDEHARPTVRSALDSFLREPVVGRYRYDADGKDAKLEGTPKGNLAPNIEFQKTVGSFVALHAMMSGVPIFGGEPKDPNSLEARLSRAVRQVNAQFQKDSGNRLSEFEPLHTVLGVHDIMKSKDLCKAVQQKLSEKPVKVDGETFAAERLPALDHDAKLKVAMHVLSDEVASGTDKHPASLTRQFFAQSKIDSGEHKLLIPIIKGMWSLSVNGLQVNQGECNPAQLKELVRQAKGASDEQFETLQGMLKALSIHEVTDLMGAANPFVPVLPATVIQKAWTSLESLCNALPQVRASASSDMDAAKALYENMHPKLSETNLVALNSAFPGEARLLQLATRIGSLARLDVSNDDQGKLVVDALSRLQSIDPQGLESLLRAYGNPDNPIYTYYAPTVVDNVKAKLVGGAPFKEPANLATALGVLAQATAHGEQVIAAHGGPEKFQEYTGADFINARGVCEFIANKVPDRDVEKGVHPDFSSLNLNAKGNLLYVTQ